MQQNVLFPEAIIEKVEQLKAGLDPMGQWVVDQIYGNMMSVQTELLMHPKFISDGGEQRLIEAIETISQRNDSEADLLQQMNQYA